MPYSEFRLKDGRVVFVRLFEKDDFESIVAMFASLSEETMRYGLPPYDRERLERWVSNLERNVILLALAGDRVVGVALIFGAAFSRYRGIGTFLTYVHQDYQNQGLGTFLTKSILEQARAKGFHRVSLEVVADNAAAIKAYERAGFMYEGRMEDAFFGDDGRYHDMLIMGVIL